MKFVLKNSNFTLNTYLENNFITECKFLHSRYIKMILRLPPTWRNHQIKFQIELPTRKFYCIYERYVWAILFLETDGISNLTLLFTINREGFKGELNRYNVDRNSAILSENIILFLIFSWFYCSFNACSVIRHFSNVNGTKFEWSNRANFLTWEKYREQVKIKIVRTWFICYFTFRLNENYIFHIILFFYCNSMNDIRGNNLGAKGLHKIY